MTVNRIPQDHWKSHDFKKIVGLILLLLAALISYLSQQVPVDPKTPDSAATTQPEKTEKTPEKTAVQFTLDTHSTGNSISVGDNEFGGAAEPGTTVILFIDKYVCGKTIADASGRWTIHRNVTLSKTSRDVRAKNAATSDYTQSAIIEVKK